MSVRNVVLERWRLHVDTSWVAEIMPRMSWLDNRALVATRATCRRLMLEVDAGIIREEAIPSRRR
jgi:hypothetical protein